MTMMGGPIDARRSPTPVNELATTNTRYEWFENNVIHDGAAELSRAPAAGCIRVFCSTPGFIAMNPERHVTSHWDFYQNLCEGD